MVTVNRRLARHLRESHDAEQIAAGRPAWESPDILPYRAWLGRGWPAGADRARPPWPVRLTPVQEEAVWEEVIRRAPGPLSGRGPAGLTATARAAREARDLLDEWGAGLDAIDPLDPDAGLFRSLAMAVERRLAEAGWIGQGGAASRVIGELGATRGGAGEEVVFAGFEELTPRQRQCVERLRAAGVGHREWHPEPQSGSRRRTVLPTREAELEAAARWARRRLEAGDPGPVGVVLPDLERHRELVEHLFSEVFTPGGSRPGQPADPRLFNLSVGPALGSVPVVRDALAALALVTGRIATAELGALLRSPFLAGAEAELTARGRLEAHLRSTGGPFSLGALIHLAAAADSGPEASPVPRLRRGWTRLAALVGQAPRRQGAEGWARTFWRGLRCLGWPGDGALDSDTYQAVEAWRELLAEFGGLDRVAPAMGAERALQRLRRLAAERMFQPRTGPAPVQILGVLETAGLTFSGLWLAGFHDGVWPRAPRPSPFIPMALQRRLRMPGASPERELERARHTTARLLASAAEVVVSRPERDGDQILRPSPLFDPLPVSEATAIPVAGGLLYFDQVHAERPRLERLRDDVAPRVGAAARGPAAGADLFRDQAACPFRAFARHRLRARAAEAAAPGLDRRGRGTLVHLVLEQVWSRLTGSAALAETSIAGLDSLLAAAVEAALSALEATRGAPVPARLREMESRRLRGLAAEWLRLEAERAPFDVIAPEGEVTAEVGGLAVSIRPDRIDRLADGTHVLIDYKTGAARLAAWFGPRPDEPQLPLYCVAHPRAIGGAMYGVVRAGESAFRGLAESDGIAPGATTPARSRVREARALGSWEAVREDWRGSMEALARRFLAGDAEVDPKSRGTTCRHCDLAALCRIDERDAAERERGGPPV